MAPCFVLSIFFLARDTISSSLSFSALVCFFVGATMVPGCWLAFLEHVTGHPTGWGWEPLAIFDDGDSWMRTISWLGDFILFQPNLVWLKRDLNSWNPKFSSHLCIDHSTTPLNCHAPLQAVCDGSKPIVGAQSMFTPSIACQLCHNP